MLEVLRLPLVLPVVPLLVHRALLIPLVLLVVIGSVEVVSVLTSGGWVIPLGAPGRVLVVPRAVLVVLLLLRVVVILAIRFASIVRVVALVIVLLVVAALVLPLMRVLGPVAGLALLTDLAPVG